MLGIVPDAWNQESPDNHDMVREPRSFEVHLIKNNIFFIIIWS